METPYFFSATVRKTGLLVFGDANNKYVHQYIDTVQKCGVSHDVFTGSEANRRYPDQLKLPDSYNCVYEPHAGVLRANRAVITLQVKPSLSSYMYMINLLLLPLISHPPLRSCLLVMEVCCWTTTG